jgi:hypothetical protein
MMKQISTRLLTVLGLCMFFLSACNNSSDFTVKGVVAGADGQLMYLENVGISNVVTLDSIKLAPGGKFKFTEKRPEYPDFYRLRLNNQLINFAVDSTETISFVADAGTFATSYSVEGSENSKAIKAITLAQLDANQAISRLRKEYEDKMISDTMSSINQSADAYKQNIQGQYRQTEQNLDNAEYQSRIAQANQIAAAGAQAGQAGAGIVGSIFDKK